MAGPGDHKIKDKEIDKLQIELASIWNIQVIIVPVISEAL